MALGKTKILLATTAALSLIAGCSNYPDHGDGGMAEYTALPEYSPVLPDEPLGPEHGLRFDFHLTQLHLDQLILQGAEWCFPASVVQAKTKEKRIARELEGDLLLDAANDIIIQRKNLALLERRLDYVTNEAECVPPEHNLAFQSEVTVINHLVDILNVDNQFAVDSVEVNPKYMGNLAEAANILKEHPHLNLNVTGHTDATGTERYNDSLAMGRAKQVERYLVIFGLTPARIKTLSVGESLPLFEGETPGVRLTNRRVSIDIISTRKQGGGGSNAGY
ncbi:OmpA family protein [Vibrio astriarenae]|uniref:OmpA family protein n=1 Tax=Vibrio astriarenae TaxID=1481923 RepID=A0A7Z2T3C4_9VIBR|nr:OmpA family protein [Vibrio astriarenae]QIA63624.1 OmpA family protein [Vibrio astriarenae]